MRRPCPVNAVIIVNVIRRMRFTGIGADYSSPLTGSDAATIRAEVQDAAPSSASMGGKIVLAVSPKGSSSATDLLVVQSNVGRRTCKARQL